MSGWTPTPEQAEAAKIMAAGGFGALVLLHVRHPGSALRAFFMVCIGIGMAFIFTEDVAALLGLRDIPTAAGIGFAGKAAAESLLKHVENYTFPKLPKGGKKND